MSKPENDLRKMIISISGPGPYDNFNHIHLDNESGDHMDSIKFTVDWGGPDDCHGVGFEPDGYGGLIMTRIEDAKKMKIMHIPSTWLTSQKDLTEERYNPKKGRRVYDEHPDCEGIYAE